MQINSINDKNMIDLNELANHLNSQLRFRKLIILGDGTCVIEKVRLIPFASEEFKSIHQKISSGEIGIKKDKHYHFKGWKEQEFSAVVKRKEKNGLTEEKDVSHKISDIHDDHIKEINEILEAAVKLQEKQEKLNKDQPELKSKNSSTSSYRQEKQYDIQELLKSYTYEPQNISQHRKHIRELILSDIQSSTRHAKAKKEKEKKKKIREEESKELKKENLNWNIKQTQIKNDQLNLNPVHPLRSN